MLVLKAIAISAMIVASVILWIGFMALLPFILPAAAFIVLSIITYYALKEGLSED